MQGGRRHRGAYPGLPTGERRRLTPADPIATPEPSPADSGDGKAGGDWRPARRHRPTEFRTATLVGAGKDADFHLHSDDGRRLRREARLTGRVGGSKGRGPCRSWPERPQPLAACRKSSQVYWPGPDRLAHSDMVSRPIRLRKSRRSPARDVAARRPPGDPPPPIREAGEDRCRRGPRRIFGRANRAGSSGVFRELARRDATWGRSMPRWHPFSTMCSVSSRPSRAALPAGHSPCASQPC